MKGEGRTTVIIAGGGTGGHFFPGLAVAQAVLRLSPGAGVLFVGTKRGIEGALAPRYGYNLVTLPVSGFASLGLYARLRALAPIPLSVARCVAICLKHKPAAVLGVGGYASFPMCVAASLVGVPLMLCEQNVKPGLANRALGRLAGIVVTAFPQTARFFYGKARLLGNPVREELSMVGEENPPERPFRLLVFGGSRGARAINGAFLSAIPELSRFPGGIEIIHQTGAEDYERVKAAYDEAGLSARVEPFIHDMASAYGWCHAVVCRAGATTLAELAAARRPALLIPFPHAAMDHQTHNARGMAEVGGALWMAERDVTPETLMANLCLLAERKRRIGMARALLAVARPQAARRIAELLLEAGGAA
jgi:UDP-N-acetylglucosamine--N-acetylmuramyl-(pentapeptide) pyrophosphoryl-undecaprenol N-acetylglucosamine transferase